MPRRPGAPVPLQPSLPPLVLARHLPRHLLARGLREGALVRVRAGAYVEPQGGTVWEQRRALALARIAAVTSQLKNDPVVSHQSAALLWGLPMVDAGPRVHVIQRSAAHRRGAPDIVRHGHELSPDDVVTLAGVRVTSLERTMADCALSLPPSAAMILGDAGLRCGADPDAWSQQVERHPRRRGIVAARAVVAFADDGAESAGESLTRHLVLHAGLPVPQTQVPVATSEGVFWADVGWPEWRVAAEYDGREKYSAAGGAAGVVVAERRREVAMEREGWRVVRVTAADVRQPAAVVRDVLRAAPPGAGRRLTPRPDLTDPLRPPRPEASRPSVRP